MRRSVDQERADHGADRGERAVEPVAGGTGVVGLVRRGREQHRQAHAEHGVEPEQHHRPEDRRLAADVAQRLADLPALRGRRRGDGSSSRRRMIARATIATTLVSALTAIDHPDPMTTISTPEIAGPISPPRWKIDEFSAIALRSRRVPTISLTNAEREGPSIAIDAPVTAATTNTCQTCTQPSSTSTASTAVATRLRRTA